MDATVNKISYQPTGVYAQFVQNPTLLNQSAANKKPVEVVVPKKEEIPLKEKMKKIGKKTALAGGALLAGVVAFGFINSMHKIKLSEKYFKGIETREQFQKWMNKQFSDEQRDFYSTIYNDAEKCLNGTVGKLYKGIKRAHEFFKEYFYNY